MYALMRGLSGACILGLGYYLGLLIRYLARDVLNIPAPSLFFGSAIVIILLVLLMAIRAACSADYTR